MSRMGDIRNFIIDPVERPEHYIKGKMETIDKIDLMISDKELSPMEAMCLGNVIKYIDRHQYKGKPVDVTPIAEIPNAKPEDLSVMELCKPEEIQGPEELDLKKYTFKPGDIEELAKDERFKPIFLKQEETEEEKYTVADLNGEVIAEYDIKKNKEPEKPKEIFFKPGEIEELAKEERFKRIYPGIKKLSDEPVSVDVDGELNQTVKYLIGLASEKLAKEWHSKQGEINSLMDIDPVEALKIIREKKLL